MNLEKAIAERKSVRNYTDKKIEKQDIQKIIQAGANAPSGKNGQPWSFVLVQDDRVLFNALCRLSKYMDFMLKADCLIVVLLDKLSSYNYIKDCQAIGACIENMLLTVTELGLGACWIGEIIYRDQEVRKLLGLTSEYELMAVISLGGKGDACPGKKKPVEKTILAWK